MLEYARRSTGVWRKYMNKAMHSCMHRRPCVKVVVQERWSSELNRIVRQERHRKSWDQIGVLVRVYGVLKSPCPTKPPSTVCVPYLPNPCGVLHIWHCMHRKCW